jgi:uncharacterized protein GlcG (DUF336 family)
MVIDRSVLDLKAVLKAVRIRIELLEGRANKGPIKNCENVLKEPKVKNRYFSQSSASRKCGNPRRATIVKHHSVPGLNLSLIGGTMSAVKLEDARRVIAAAETKAHEIGQPMNIAVADEGGNIVAHVRMDGAWIGSIDISQKKAYTSRAFDIATKDLAQHSQSGGQFFGIHASNDGRIMIFAGGVPLKRDGKVVGAIGVSGGSGEQDHAVAEAGAAAY